MNEWARQGGEAAHPVLTTCLAALVFAGPLGHAAGTPFYIVGDVERHVQPPGWDVDLNVFRRLLVVNMCALAWASCARRNNEGWAAGVCNVVSVIMTLLLIFGVNLTRATELDVTEATGWGLWMTVPYTYVCLLPLKIKRD